MGRTTKVTSKDSEDTELANVSYTYDGIDNMTEIVRGDGMKYVLAYNNFHNLESIGIEGKDEKLVSYTYKSGNGRLKEMTYANGDKMKASYNSAGQLVAERWYDASENLTAHYKYVYDGQGNVVRSIDVLSLKEYNYSYEDGRIVRATECDITLNSSEMVTSKNLVNSIIYYYDREGSLTRKRIIPASGSEQVIYYENPENENAVVKFTAGGKAVTSYSKNDSFGRKVFDELQLGTGFVSRQFDYHAGEVTEEHLEGDKLKSTPTTQLVKRITLSDGRTLDYEYDGEERITKVIDSVDGTTSYTYDSLGQLLTEAVNGTVVNSMTYDNYGNILTKNGVAYTYGDSIWKDKLTGYGDRTITYDEQGNPTSYLGHTLSWEKGRQLKQLTRSDGTMVSYTYNANGIRTSKTVDGVKHTYTLDGTKILKETWGSNTLIQLYDNEGEVCGIILNDEPYYFYKNQQGDIIALTNKDAETIARYTYDAWGKVLSVTDAEGGEITDQANIAHINPYRYRGYYYDTDIELYYLQSRYYNPVVGRFVNGDEAVFAMIAVNVLGSNLFAYCYNGTTYMKDDSGFATINALFAAIGAIAGAKLGKYVAKELGYTSGVKYWAIRAGFIVGGAVIGWFASKTVIKILANYLKKNSQILFKYIEKYGAAKVYNAMKFLGINPFELAKDSSKLIALLRKFNSKSVTIGYKWAIKMYEKIIAFGYKITLDKPHGDYTWHVHVSGGNGKFDRLHIQIVKKHGTTYRKRLNKEVKSMRYDISSSNTKYRGVERTVDTSDFPKKCKNKEYCYLLDLLFKYISVSDEQNSIENFEKMKKIFMEFREHGVECEIKAHDSKPMQDLYGYPLEFLGFDIVLEEAESLLADDVPLIVKRELNENGLCKTETDVARFIPYLDHGVDIWEPCYVYRVIC